MLLPEKESGIEGVSRTFSKMATYEEVDQGSHRKIGWLIGPADLQARQK